MVFDFELIKVEFDSLSALSLFLMALIYTSHVIQIRDLLKQLSSWSVIHVHWKVNKVVDCFAKFGLNISSSVGIFIQFLFLLLLVLRV